MRRCLGWCSPEVCYGTRAWAGQCESNANACCALLLTISSKRRRLRAPVMASSPKSSVGCIVRSMFQERWSDPIQPDHWGRAPGRLRLYVIERRRDRHRPIGRSIDNEGKLGGFPPNFPLYIGASSSEHRGIRTRLASHRRGAGNRHISAALLEGDELWFVYVESTCTSRRAFNSRSTSGLNSRGIYCKLAVNWSISCCRSIRTRPSKTFRTETQSNSSRGTNN